MNIKEVISKKRWDLLTENYSAKSICTELSFSEAISLANEFFYDDIQDDSNQQFALNLVFNLRELFNEEWKKDWKHEVFLGHLCAFLWRYEDQDAAYKRAYDMLQDPPAELLLLLAGCNSAPGVPPIDDEASERYLARALDKNLTYEGALMMRAVARRKADLEMESYWDHQLKELEQRNIHAEPLIPDILKA